MNKQEKNLVVIRVFGREEKTQDGKKYVRYTYTPNGEDFYRVVFKQTCLTTPKETGFHLVQVEDTAVSFKERKKQNGYVEKLMYIETTEKVAKDVEYEKKFQEQRLEKTKSILSVGAVSEDELPW